MLLNTASLKTEFKIYMLKNLQYYYSLFSLLFLNFGLLEFELNFTAD